MSKLKEWLDDDTFYNARCSKESVIGGWTRSYPEGSHQVIVGGGYITVADLFDIPEDKKIWWSPCPDEGPEKVFGNMVIIVEYDNHYRRYYIQGEELYKNVGKKLSLLGKNFSSCPKEDL